MPGFITETIGYCIQELEIGDVILSIDTGDPFVVASIENSRVQAFPLVVENLSMTGMTIQSFDHTKVVELRPEEAIYFLGTLRKFAPSLALRLVNILAMRKTQES